MRVREHYESFRTFFLRTGKTSYLRTGKAIIPAHRKSIIPAHRKKIISAGRKDQQGSYDSGSLWNCVRNKNMTFL